MQASTLRWWLVGAEDEREKAPASLYFMLTVIDSFAKGQEEEGRGGIKNRNKLFTRKGRDS